MGGIMAAQGIGAAYSALKDIPGQVAPLHNPHNHMNYHIRTREAGICKQLAMQNMNYHSQVGNTSMRGGLGMEAAMLHRNY
jgi:hypothetical protein